MAESSRGMEVNEKYSAMAAHCNFGRITVLSLLYMLIGPLLIMVNKIILKDIGFAYPMALCSLGQASTAVFGWLAVLSGYSEVRPETRDAVRGAAYLRISLPIAAMNALTMSSGNAVYMFLGVGFIQMLKSFTPAIVLAVMLCTGAPLPNSATLKAVAVIIFGTLLEVKGELHPTRMGVTLMLMSEVSEAIKLLLVQRLMQERKFSIVESFCLVAPVTVTVLLGCSMAREWPVMYNAGHHLLPLRHLGLFVAASTVGLAVNWVNFALLQLTSALFVKVANTVRNVGLVAFSVVALGEKCTLLEGIGYVITLSGFAAYSQAMMQEKAATCANEAVVDDTSNKLSAIVGKTTISEPPSHVEDEEHMVLQRRSTSSIRNSGDEGSDATSSPSPR